MFTTITKRIARRQSAPSPYDFHVIGIGSSTGGLEPLKTIIAGLPPDLPAAVIVVHHGAGDAPEGLAQMLQRVSPLPVIDVHQNQRIQPGNIYVTVPGELVRLRDFILTMGGKPPGGKPGRLIDACFRSLAYEAREKAIAVILSGGGYDGVEGAKAIERLGGLVIAQDPATAKFPLMPVAIIANDDPSFVLGPDEIRELINSQLGS